MTPRNLDSVVGHNFDKVPHTVIRYLMMQTAASIIADLESRDGIRPSERILRQYSKEAFDPEVPLKGYALALEHMVALLYAGIVACCKDTHKPRFTMGQEFMICKALMAWQNFKNDLVKKAKDANVAAYTGEFAACDWTDICEPFRHWNTEKVV